MVLELLVELAATLEVCVRRAPGGRVGRVDVFWDGSAREEPDLDILRGPLHGEDAAFGRVEGVAVGGGAFILVGVLVLASSAGGGDRGGQGWGAVEEGRG